MPTHMFCKLVTNQLGQNGRCNNLFVFSLRHNALKKGMLDSNGWGIVLSSYREIAFKLWYMVGSFGNYK
jgi:hypothetical protein